MPVSADTHDNIKNYYDFIASGKDFESYLSDKIDASYIKNIADDMNRHYKDPNMFDMLLQEIDRHMRDDYASYLSSKNSIADFVKDNTNSTLSSAYQSVKSTKLLSSGSLISIGA